MMFTRVEFGQGSVTTVVCRRHRAFEDRAEDDDHDHGGGDVGDIDDVGDDVNFDDFGEVDDTDYDDNDDGD